MAPDKRRSPASPHAAALAGRRRNASLAEGPLSWPRLALIGLLLAAAGTFHFAMGGRYGPLYYATLALLAAALATALYLAVAVRRSLQDPLERLSNWAVSMREGDLSARVALPATGEFVSLARDMNALAEQLQELTASMGAQVRAQTARISTKTRSLEILYEVVASLNISRSRDELLANFLETLVELLDARAANVGLFAGSAGWQIVASHGNMDEQLSRWITEDHFEKISSSVTHDGRMKIHRLEGVPEPADSPELIVVPIQYRDRIIGLFNVFLDHSSTEFGADFRDLLTSVGRHVGLALEKTRLDENARRLAIMEERDILRIELHDSLAQSLVSMRLQVKMLGEILHRKDLRSAQNEVRRLRMALDEAHTSLRELLASFRARMDDRGLIPAIEETVDRFHQDTGIPTFFQVDCVNFNLTPTQEVELFRIVQEALANIRRHSGANAARVFLSCDHEGQYHLLVEDDGIGMIESALKAGHGGKHLGVNIMRERALRLNGTLKVESEPGEGTRISLRFSPIARPAAAAAS
jgi:two-component system nitrate/nitrite sensor histidine kinase NarX